MKRKFDTIRGCITREREREGKREEENKKQKESKQCTEEL